MVGGHDSGAMLRIRVRECQPNRARLSLADAKKKDLLDRGTFDAEVVPKEGHTVRVEGVRYTVIHIEHCADQGRMRPEVIVTRSKTAPWDGGMFQP